MSTRQYPPIADYAFIADCHSAALVSKSGSIDWCCMPRIDSPSCFGRLVGWQQGGYCQIAPKRAYTVSRRYLDHTLILQTTFHTDDGGEARLTDCFTMREGGEHHPYQQILRIIEGVKGSVEFDIDIVARFDYGSVKPWIRQPDDKHFTVIGGSDGLIISGDVGCKMKHRHDLEGTCIIEQGRRKYLSMVFRRSEEVDEGLFEIPATGELDRRFEETVEWWARWTEKGHITAPYAEYVWRSAVVLKGLSHAPTGAIAAAATTSLPEIPGGTRNWDYRYTWIRDSCFTVRSLSELGFDSESEGFRKFVERSAAGSAEELQILFGVGGERRLNEMTVRELEGYRGAQPVRIGNAAEVQRQLDVYGELLDLAWRWHDLGHSPDDDYWEFITELVNSAARLWKKPDQGIWEMRGAPRHFVQSKVMCWAAIDSGIRLAEDLGRDGPLAKWKKVRDEIRGAVEEKGYDARRGVFIQAFGHHRMDAALLLLPTV
ncbi:MAG: glycoside hydrolase family 15 protein, partial [Desulforhopalus sp.]